MKKIHIQVEDFNMFLEGVEFVVYSGTIQLWSVGASYCNSELS